MSLVEAVLKRPTGSNLLAWVLLLTGLYSATSLTREFFPESSPESASVTAIWPGAAPEDLEEGVHRQVESVVEDEQRQDEVEVEVRVGVRPLDRGLRIAKVGAFSTIRPSKRP